MRVLISLPRPEKISKSNSIPAAEVAHTDAHTTVHRRMDWTIPTSI